MSQSIDDMYRDMFTAEEQQTIDDEICRTCGLPYSEHDGREEHRFAGSGIIISSDKKASA